VIDGRFIQDHFPGVGRFCFGLLAGLADRECELDLVVPFAPAGANTRFDFAPLARRHLSLVPCAAPVLSLGEQVAMPRLAARSARPLALAAPGGAVAPAVPRW